MLGEQIIKGMAVTARNFFGSYVSKDRLTTVQYPEERLTPKENTRQFPFLVYDGDDPEKGLRCVACQICEKECPPKCIYIVKSGDKKPDALGKRGSGLIASRPLRRLSRLSNRPSATAETSAEARLLPTARARAKPPPASATAQPARAPRWKRAASTASRSTSSFIG